MAEMRRVDVHQHVWTPPLLAALRERKELPFVRHSGDLIVLHSAGEQPYLIDVAREAPQRRRELLRADGLDLALVAISSPIGIESLPRHEAQPLIQAHLDGVDELGPGFAAWGPVALDQPDPHDVDAALARGCIGISLPACALAGVEALRATNPILRRAAERGAPVFVHPGRCASDSQPLNQPLWWGALTDYVAQMQAAWLAFAALARREHPHLTVVFAMLAGGAPLLSERLEARGGPRVDVRDPRVYYETSSYGPSAIESMARRVGTEQLLYGSDRPVIEPMTSGREIPLQVSAGRLLSPTLANWGTVVRRQRLVDAA